jgi:hypothetical protein
MQGRIAFPADSSEQPIWVREGHGKQLARMPAYSLWKNDIGDNRRPAFETLVARDFGPDNDRPGRSASESGSEIPAQMQAARRISLWLWR